MTRAEKIEEAAKALLHVLYMDDALWAGGYSAMDALRASLALPADEPSDAEAMREAAANVPSLVYARHRCLRWAENVDAEIRSLPICASQGRPTGGKEAT